MGTGPRDPSPPRRRAQGPLGAPRGQTPGTLPLHAPPLTGGRTARPLQTAKPEDGGPGLYPRSSGEQVSDNSAALPGWGAGGGRDLGHVPENQDSALRGQQPRQGQGPAGEDHCRRPFTVTETLGRVQMFQCTETWGGLRGGDWDRAGRGGFLLPSAQTEGAERRMGTPACLCSGLRTVLCAPAHPGRPWLPETRAAGGQPPWHPPEDPI